MAKPTKPYPVRHGVKLHPLPVPDDKGPWQLWSNGFDLYALSLVHGVFRLRADRTSWDKVEFGAQKES